MGARGGSALYAIMQQHEAAEGTYATPVGTTEGTISTTSALGMHTAEVDGPVQPFKEEIIFLTTDRGSSPRLCFRHFTLLHLLKVARSLMALTLNVAKSVTGVEPL